MSTPPATQSVASQKRKREHPLFTANPAITSARQAPDAGGTASVTSSASISARFIGAGGPDAKTANGAATFSTSGSACLDLFFRLVRGVSTDQVHGLMPPAWAESAELTLQVLMHGRDCRGGKGERLVITDALLWLRAHKPCTYIANLLGFLRVGYFKDLLKIAERVDAQDGPRLGHSGELLELEVLAEFLRYDAQQLTKFNEGKNKEKEKQLNEPTLQDEHDSFLDDDEQVDEKQEKKGNNRVSTPVISLAAKWAPSEKSHYDGSPLHFARRLSRLLYSHASRPLFRYRQLLSALRQHLDVVERRMCAGQWEAIQFERVPSKAHKILKRAFERHQEERYSHYLADVKGGTKEIKSAGLQPHELTAPYRQRHAAYDETTELQWKALVEKIKGMSGGLRGAVAVVDVSGSMMNGAGSVAPIDPAIALGLLIAEVNEGAFHHRVLTFDTTPAWHIIPEDSLLAQVQSLLDAPWGGWTNLQATFDLILSLALAHSLPPASLPSTLIILSDMQFNVACSSSSLTNFEVMQTKYALAGYRLPRVLFWNLNGRGEGTPVTMGEKGVVLLSGYSGELLRVLLSGQDMDPYTVMRLAVAEYEVQVEEHEM